MTFIRKRSKSCLSQCRKLNAYDFVMLSFLSVVLHTQTVNIVLNSCYTIMLQIGRKLRFAVLYINSRNSEKQS